MRACAVSRVAARFEGDDFRRACEASHMAEREREELKCALTLSREAQRCESQNLGALALGTRLSLASMSAAAGSSESGLGISGRQASCRCGQLCYGKNPDHWKQSSHPDAEDYADPGGVCEEVKCTPAAASAPERPLAQGGGFADGRPRCRYGRQCYRKNPAHWCQFSHPGDHCDGAAHKDDEDVEPDVSGPSSLGARGASWADATLEGSDGRGKELGVAPEVSRPMVVASEFRGRELKMGMWPSLSDLAPVDVSATVAPHQEIAIQESEVKLHDGIAVSSFIGVAQRGAEVPSDASSEDEEWVLVEWFP